MCVFELKHGENSSVMFSICFQYAVLVQGLVSWCIILNYYIGIECIGAKAPDRFPLPF